MCVCVCVCVIYLICVVVVLVADFTKNYPAGQNLRLKKHVQVAGRFIANIYNNTFAGSSKLLLTISRIGSEL